MGIRIRDLIEEGVALEARCLGCGRITVWRGAKLLSPFGPDTSLPALVNRLRCRQCGMPAAALLRFDDTEATREAHRRGHSPHRKYG